MRRAHEGETKTALLEIRLEQQRAAAEEEEKKRLGDVGKKVGDLKKEKEELAEEMVNALDAVLLTQREQGETLRALEEARRE